MRPDTDLLVPPKGTRLFEKKKKIEARLNCLKTKLRDYMIEKGRKRHFRKADTVAFDSQFSAAGAAQTSSRDAPRAKPIEYHLPERAAVVRLTCTPADGLPEQGKLSRRIKAIEARGRAVSSTRKPPPPPTPGSRQTGGTGRVFGGLDRGEERSVSPGMQTHSMHLLPGERKQAISGATLRVRQT
ncbi:hypothetical protein ABVK25_010779 [Lepraria finkii]|uniref:Uncharacterized protein n=1 Tax=Lepraria finkii TaxID=1340010 RepID=A0ABR4ATL5_9LECA